MSAFDAELNEDLTGRPVAYEGTRYTVAKVTPGSRMTYLRAERHDGTIVFPLSDLGTEVTLIE
ncbi:hypothetical protein M197_gp58 [Haloarcula hispanica tailed virus 2]|uniref:Uncharacterized protein n=1 Tax=Haloarcula hispanica tailed virus 2 TaxID=1273751 RepID=R4TM32_9CAUD|nr:hypothetical protein M197_gp58 [Haloarcula hispanica tailed virus 2]AGM11223.1 hypothetical protein HHTV2_58 [Haloarcula hispanica tailed virus 2]